MKKFFGRTLAAVLLLGTLFALPGGAGAHLPGPALSNPQSGVPSGPHNPQSYVPPGPGDWPMHGHDAQRTNYNPNETLISSGNVNQLVQRWQQFVGNNGTATSAAPSIANGVAYVASSAATGT